MRELGLHSHIAVRFIAERQLNPDFAAMIPRCKSSKQHNSASKLSDWSPFAGEVVWPNVRDLRIFL